MEHVPVVEMHFGLFTKELHPKLISNNQNITCGVPHGSTLGAPFFTQYVNDLPLATNFDVKLFADDTNLTISNYNVKDMPKNANIDEENIVDWKRSD